MKIVRVKTRDNRLGILMIPSRTYSDTLQMFQSLNNVWLEDGSTVLVGDDDLEVIDNDRSKRFIEEIEQLYNQ